MKHFEKSKSVTAFLFETMRHDIFTWWRRRVRYAHDGNYDDNDEEEDGRGDTGSYPDLLLVLQEDLSSPSGVRLLDIGPRHRIWTASPLSASPIRLCCLDAFLSFCA